MGRPGPWKGCWPGSREGENMGRVCMKVIGISVSVVSQWAVSYYNFLAIIKGTFLIPVVVNKLIFLMM